MHTRTILPFAFALLLPACRETEEEITVRPDGSLHVELQAKGNVEDLADGYPIPLGGPWEARNDETRAWLARFADAIPRRASGR